MAALEIHLLAADHPERRLDQLARDSGPRDEREAERLGDERVAGEDRRRLAVGGPDARLPAALRVVVERGQVVVHERERVHELDRRRGREQPVEVPADRLARREAQHRPHALPAERVAHRLVERRRAPASAPGSSR